QQPTNSQPLPPSRHGPTGLKGYGPARLFLCVAKLIHRCSSSPDVLDAVGLLKALATIALLAGSAITRSYSCSDVSVGARARAFSRQAPPVARLRVPCLS